LPENTGEPVEFTGSTTGPSYSEQSYHPVRYPGVFIQRASGLISILSVNGARTTSSSKTTLMVFVSLSPIQNYSQISSDIIIEKLVLKSKEKRGANHGLAINY